MINHQHHPRHAGTTPQQEALFREALDAATDAIGMSTPQGHHYYQNHAFTDLFGDIGDNPPVTLYTDSVIGHQVFAVLKAGGRWEGEVRMNGRGGQILDIDLRAYAIMDEDGRIQALVGIHTDITGRKQTERALHESLDQRNATLNALPDILFELDIQGRIYNYHAPRESLLYVPPEQFLGRNMLHVLPEAAGRIIRAALDEAARTGRHRGSVYSLTMHDQEHWFELSIAATEVPLPPEGRMIVLIRDITDRKLAEDALVRLNAELEQRVEERTRLAKQRAEQLQRLARRLAESEQDERRRIARVLHEDLQQILVGVQYQLHLLRAHDPARVAETEAQLRQALRVSSTLTTELSPTILYEEGLSAALPWLAAQMQASYGLTVRTAIRTERATDGDGTSVFLYHAARELLFNVVKHAEVQEASVELDATTDNRLRLTVADQGTGFEPRRPPASDQGFGLFEIRERIEHLGGAFTIDSAPGKGTCITLTL